jgi:hypothetical protein
MQQLEINGINLPLNPAMHTWQDLLDELESTHLGEDKVISSVIFDGSEVLQFRDRETLNRSLQSIGEVKIEAVVLEEMLRRAMFDAEGYLLSLQTSMVDTAETFRHQRLDEANDKLSQVLQGIKMLAALLQGIELSLTAQGKLGPGGVERVLTEMGPTLEGLIDSQTQKDWILVADILEFELLANLASFEQTILEFKQKLI